MIALEDHELGNRIYLDIAPFQVIWKSFSDVWIWQRWPTEPSGNSFVVGKFIRFSSYTVEHGGHVLRTSVYLW